MAAAHPYGAFVGCGIKRIGCTRRIKVKYNLVHFLSFTPRIIFSSCIQKIYENYIVL